MLLILRCLISKKKYIVSKESDTTKYFIVCNFYYDFLIGQLRCLRGFHYFLFFLNHHVQNWIDDRICYEVLYFFMDYFYINKNF